jgi:hypothetical protein
MTPSREPAPLRRHVYALLIVVAAGMALGHILHAELVLEPSRHRREDDPNDHRRRWPATRPKPMPTFSSNDRSRWATVRALVDRGTYVIGHRYPASLLSGSSASALVASPQTGGPLLAAVSAAASEELPRGYIDTGIVFDDGYGTVDKVLNPETQDFYSSKPPLLPTMMAGEYWLLRRTLGWSITEQHWSVVRVIVLTFNWLPWILYLVLLARLAERFGSTDWGRVFVVGTACFGTLMTPFLISINNHTVAASSAVVALYFAARIFLDERQGAIPFALAGLTASFTACNELPAASFLVGLSVLLLWRFPRQTLLYFVPAAILPVAALFYTNYLAIGELAPAYSKFGGPWYQYEGSHWRLEPGQVKYGIDWAGNREDRATYAFHVLLGHHGVFSLTPVFLLSLAGMLWGGWRLLAYLVSRRQEPSPDDPSSAVMDNVPSPLTRRVWAWFAGFTLAMSVVVTGFYLVRTDNYGGWSAGPRWLLWLTPFWLLTMLPMADRLGATRWGRWLAYLFLVLSVMAAAYPLWNPWRHPWIYDFMDAQGWIPY